MTLTELRYIVAVARERHFGRAATRCFVSQPTLSIAVKNLKKNSAFRYLSVAQKLPSRRKVSPLFNKRSWC